MTTSEETLAVLVRALRRLHHAGSDDVNTVIEAEALVEALDARYLTSPPLAGREESEPRCTWVDSDGRRCTMAATHDPKEVWHWCYSTPPGRAWPSDTNEAGTSFPADGGDGPDFDKRTRAIIDPARQSDGGDGTMIVFGFETLYDRVRGALELEDTRLAKLRAELETKTARVTYLEGLVRACRVDQKRAYDKRDAADATLTTERAAREKAERERDAYKRAKEENDERFILERDSARRERDAMREALVAARGELLPAFKQHERCSACEVKKVMAVIDAALAPSPAAPDPVAATLDAAPPRERPLSPEQEAARERGLREVKAGAFAAPVAAPETTAKCDGHWRTLDGRLVGCQFDAKHAGPCWDAVAELPPACAPASAETRRREGRWGVWWHRDAEDEEGTLDAWLMGHTLGQPPFDELEARRNADRMRALYPENTYEARPLPDADAKEKA